MATNFRAGVGPDGKGQVAFFLSRLSSANEKLYELDWQIWFSESNCIGQNLRTNPNKRCSEIPCASFHRSLLSWHQTLHRASIEFKYKEELNDQIRLVYHRLLWAPMWLSHHGFFPRPDDAKWAESRSATTAGTITCLHALRCPPRIYWALVVGRKVRRRRIFRNWLLHFSVNRMEGEVCGTHWHELCSYKGLGWSTASFQGGCTCLVMGASA